jgi:hypothetical protein
LNKIGVISLLVLGLCSCTHNPVPADYSGPLAKIKDSVVVPNASQENLFYLAQINGQKIEDALLANTPAKGPREVRIVTSVALVHDVPAQQATFQIVGRTFYPKPALESTLTVYQVKGDVEFAPLPDHTYTIKGQLGEKYSAVWIIDNQTMEIVGPKIEINGSAALPFYEK